jgi:hypothetical protein
MESGDPGFRHFDTCDLGRPGVCADGETQRYQTEAAPAAGNPFGSFNPEDTYQFIVLCYNRADGSLRWQQVARAEVPHEGHHRDHGFASASPVTDGEHLYVISVRAGFTVLTSTAGGFGSGTWAICKPATTLAKGRRPRCTAIRS